MTPTPPCGSPAAKKLGCTCDTEYMHNGHKAVFVPITCPVHSPFYKQPDEVTE